MEADWQLSQKYILNKKYNNFKKEGNDYELWRIWWTICATRIKRKIK